MSEAPETAFEIMARDPDYIGSCTCFTVEIDGTLIEGHCWRVCMKCQGCGLHYEGDRAVVERIKPLFDAMDWYGKWTIRKGLRRSARASQPEPRSWKYPAG